MAGDSAVGRLGRPLADHDLLADEALAARPGASARDAQRPAGPQAGDELSLQRASALNVESLVDRLMGDPHRLIIGKLDLQPVGDLLGAPRRRPPAVLAARLVAALPCPGRGPGHRCTTRPANLTGEPLLNVVAQPLVGGELRRLRAPGHQLRLPLRDRSPVLELAATRGRVAAQLPRNCRRRPIQAPGDLANARASRPQQRDLLALLKAQIPTRQRLDHERGHSATLSKPPAASRLRGADRKGGLLAAQPLRDLMPEQPLDVAPQRRLARRLHRRPARQLGHPPSRPAHHSPPCSGVATTS